VLAWQGLRSSRSDAADTIGTSQKKGDVTLPMAALLEERSAAVDPFRVQFAVNDRRADLLAERLKGLRPSKERIEVQCAHASELVSAGRFDEALRALDELEKDGPRDAPWFWEKRRPAALLLRASAHLRRAEEERRTAASEATRTRVFSRSRARASTPGGKVRHAQWKR
jgi:predicted Zn-dependent protease